MATLTNLEKTSVRRSLERKANAQGVTITWNKAAVDAAAQAVEDAIAATSAQLLTTVDTALAAHGVVIAEYDVKRAIADHVILNFFRREGVL